MPTRIESPERAPITNGIALHILIQGIVQGDLIYRENIGADLNPTQQNVIIAQPTSPFVKILLFYFFEVFSFLIFLNHFILFYFIHYFISLL